MSFAPRARALTTEFRASTVPVSAFEFRFWPISPSLLFTNSILRSLEYNDIVHISRIMVKYQCLCLLVISSAVMKPPGSRRGDALKARTHVVAELPCLKVHPTPVIPQNRPGNKQGQTPDLLCGTIVWRRRKSVRYPQA